jgi:hypothetical protein
MKTTFAIPRLLELSVHNLPETAAQVQPDLPESGVPEAAWLITVAKWFSGWRYDF